jgi:FlaA1/EpsC-like NDP-sugar epimerase
LHREEIDYLVIAINYLNHKRKLEIFDLCNEFKIPCKVVSSPRDWVQGKLSLGDIRSISIEDLLGREEIKLINPKIEESIKGKVVLVTGAAGSIGSELSRQLMQLSPSKLLLLDLAETPLYDLEQEFKNSPFSVDWEIILCDIRDKDKLTCIFEIYHPDLLFHAAAYKHVPMMEMYPEEAIGTNVFGTRNLVNLAVDYQLSKFVMVSTDKAVNPTNVMGASKRLSEMYAQSMAVYLEEKGAYKTKFITTRFGNVLGSNGSVLPLFRKQLESGGPLTVTHKDIIRYFMTIPEACQLVLEASIMGNGGEIFVFDMGDPIRIYDLAKKYIELSGKEVGKDIQIVFTGLRPGEKMYEELFNVHEERIPTYHDKINIAKVSSEDFYTLKIKLQELEECFKMNNKKELVRTLLQIVPEFTSSTYDLLKKD